MLSTLLLAGVAHRRGGVSASGVVVFVVGLPCLVCSLACVGHVSCTHEVVVAHIECYIYIYIYIL